ncbi:MAG: DNA mismatch repair protein [Crocinitomicaceae bacterium]|nr:DNA mismatch repair protein [Crocinitomicaceae bacterium]
MEAKVYKEQVARFEEELKGFNSRYNLLGSIRLVIGLAIPILFYFFLTTYQNAYLIGCLVLLTAFLFLVRIHVNLKNQREIVRALIQINQNEIAFIENGTLSFTNGKEFIDPHHPYSYDLDLFGDRSIYQILNRTSTFIGSQKLAEYLLELKSIEEIQNRQKAVAELEDKLEFRQKIAAFGMARKDSQEIHNELIEWSRSEIVEIPKWLVYLSYILPVFTFVSLGFLIAGHHLPWGKITVISGVFNLALVMRQFKHVKGELLNTTKIDLILGNYSRIIEQIEAQNFESEKLKELQNKLKTDASLASQNIAKLSSIFGQLENIQNPVGAMLFNALIMYHVRTMSDLEKWKKHYISSIQSWLEVIGEMEALSSLSNFHYNNPSFCFPEINQQKQLEFEELGHPMIHEKVRVCNDLKYDQFKFIILTGSNMSGKSTFLRSLGVNMVLAQAGSSICAKSANVHPMQVLVSMRVTDNLNENESFFFAEVKRLKETMEKASNSLSFVLLDEILRGTNSNDKREGTIGVIKKLIQKDIYGAIATHDLKVCDITKDHPGILSNKNFEVEIQNEDLHFDYKLREGVCKNKSATFLMEKMEII